MSGAVASHAALTGDALIDAIMYSQLLNSLTDKDATDRKSVV